MKTTNLILLIAALSATSAYAKSTKRATQRHPAQLGENSWDDERLKGFVTQFYKSKGITPADMDCNGVTSDSGNTIGTCTVSLKDSPYFQAAIVSENYPKNENKLKVETKDLFVPH
jgi:hypothetical protein